VISTKVSFTVEFYKAREILPVQISNTLEPSNQIKKTEKGQSTSITETYTPETSKKIVFMEKDN
jgi:hypothetical protein